MKRKFINYLLVASVMFGATAMVSSCKDTDEDLYAQLKGEQATIEEKLKQDINDLTTVNDDLKLRIAALEAKAGSCKDSCRILWEEAIQQALAGYTKTEDLDSLINKYLVDNQYDKMLQDYLSMSSTLAAMEDMVNNIDSVLNAPETGVLDRLTAVEILADQVKQGMEANKLSIDTLKLFQSTWEPLLPVIQQRADSALTMAKANKSSIDSLWAMVNSLTSCDCASKIQGLEDKINILNTSLDSLAAEVDSAKEAAAYALEVANENLIEAKNYTDEIVEAAVSALTEAITGVNDKVNDLTTDVATLNGLLSSEVQRLEGLISAAESRLQGKIDALDVRITKNEADILQLQNDLNELTGKVSNLEDYVNKLITGLLVQGTYNPVFGSFALPIEVRSNVLVSYWGQLAEDVDFPAASAIYEYNGQQVITNADMQMLMSCGLNAQVYTDGTVLLNDNAGTLYLTVNPANVDLSTTNFTLVNSRDEESGYALTTPESCNDLLTFGYTRGENGFYKAYANLKGNTIDEQIQNLNKVKINIEPGLGWAVKDVLKDIVKAVKERKRPSGDHLAVLAKRLYDQFNGMLPAMGVKAAWTNEYNEAQSAYSQYSIAATAFRPLSYKFLYDASMPSIPALPDIDFDNLLDFDTPTVTITVPTFTVDFAGINLDVNIDLKLDVSAITTDQIKVDITDYPIGYDAETGKLITEPRTFYATGLDNLLDQISAQLESQSVNINAQIDAAFDAAMGKIKTKIEEAVNNFINDLSTSINDQLADVLNDIKDQLSGKIESVTTRFSNLYNRLQSLINAVNARLENPNHYLQTLVLYKNEKNDFGRLSTTRALPSQFKLAGGDAIYLFPTSYNAEIVAPAYKKFVAVTNVYSSDLSVSAQGGDATCLAMVKGANEYLNKVISGQQRCVGLRFANAKPNYIYEIVYSALDYHGVTSTQKYYIQVR